MILSDLLNWIRDALSHRRRTDLDGDVSPRTETERAVKAPLDTLEDRTEDGDPDDDR